MPAPGSRLTGCHSVTGRAQSSLTVLSGAVILRLDRLLATMDPELAQQLRKMLCLRCTAQQALSRPFQCPLVLSWAWRLLLCECRQPFKQRDQVHDRNLGHSTLKTASDSSLSTRIQPSHAGCQRMSTKRDWACMPHCAASSSSCSSCTDYPAECQALAACLIACRTSTV